MDKKVIYLDNNATTAVAPEVFEAMKPYFCERYGNPSSIHRFGGSVAADIENARRQVADLLGATYRDKDNCATEIIFTSCGTESDNAAINAALNAMPDRKKVVTTAVEHPAILHYCEELTRKGIEVVIIGVDGQGKLDMTALKNAVDSNTAIVSAMWGNNETGTIFPVAEIAAIAHAQGAYFHTDAVQAAGKVKIDVQEVNADFLSISGHKLHAPKGVGALFVRRGIVFTPLICGGHQERSRRGGTENVTSIIGLGKACEIAREKLKEEYDKLAVAMLKRRKEGKHLVGRRDAVYLSDKRRSVAVKGGVHVFIGKVAAAVACSHDFFAHTVQTLNERDAHAGWGEGRAGGKTGGAAAEDDAVAMHGRLLWMILFAAERNAVI